MLFERPLNGLVAGLIVSNTEIAEHLRIIELTVKTHVSRILAKFGVRQRPAVAAKLRPFR